MSTLPRYTKLPPFNPHRKDFTCVYQDLYLPPIDPQAELLFQQALTLDDPDAYAENKDWDSIFQLYQRAAELGHWKAMLNLASLRLKVDSNPETAISLVEKAMLLGVPDAWDMMGIYHMRQIVKGGNADSAYAFFQRAAEMGSPRALVFLGEALDAGWDNLREGFWANEPIAQKMLQCAIAQGDGDAASQLSFDYSDEGSGPPEDKRRAIELLHEAMKLGSDRAASELFVQFDGMYLTVGENLVDYADKARSERYSKLCHALEFYKILKLPNLDKVLPLPPAPLPKWNGDKHMLLNAAKPVALPVITPVLEPRNVTSILPNSAPTPIPQSSNKQYARIRQLTTLPPRLVACNGSQTCPETGIWEGRVAEEHPLAKVYNKWDRQAYVEKGNPFPDPRAQFLDIAMRDVRWTWFGNANTEIAPGVHEITL